MKPADLVFIGGDDYRTYRRNLRRMMISIVLLMAVSMGSVVFTQWQIRETQKAGATRAAETLQLARETHAILIIVEAATSPQAKATEAAVLQKAINQIDCNSRKALQGLIDILVDDGTLKPSEISLTTNC